MMRASISDAGIGETLRLFEDRWVDSGGPTPMTNWDVHPDGTSFVFVKGPRIEPGDSGEQPVVQIEIALNFFEELKERMGGELTLPR